MKALLARRGPGFFFLELELLRTEALLFKKVPSVVRILADSRLLRIGCHFSGHTCPHNDPLTL